MKDEGGRMNPESRPVWRRCILHPSSFILFLLFLLLLAGCDKAAPVSVDAPQLASSLRWVGTCAVICSTVGGIALVIATRNRRK